MNWRYDLPKCQPTEAVATDAERLAELQLLVDEYDPLNSDWGFRRIIITELIGKLRRTEHHVPDAGVREALARAYLIGRGYDICKIDDFKSGDYADAEWKLALQITAALTAPVTTAAWEPDDVEITKYDDPMFNLGVAHVVDMLARTLEPLDAWYAGDGSEDYDCDLEQTLRNILAAKGLYNKETGEFASPHASAERAKVVEVCACIAENFYLTIPEEKEMLRANNKAVGEKMAAAIRAALSNAGTKP